ncbi:hypothetical protein TTY48_26960 [Tsukamurella sp. TY48]|nr:hypothetical protein TTY48_26960 [Tsukamurella sp. TY48]
MEAVVVAAAGARVKPTEGTRVTIIAVARDIPSDRRERGGRGAVTRGLDMRILHMGKLMAGVPSMLR